MKMKIYTVFLFQMLTIIKMKCTSEELILDPNRIGERMESAVDVTRFWMQLLDERRGASALALDVKKRNWSLSGKCTAVWIDTECFRAEKKWLNQVNLHHQSNTH